MQQITLNSYTSMAYLRHLYLTENCFLDIDSIREAIFFGKLLKIKQNEIKTGINDTSLDCDIVLYFR